MDLQTIFTEEYVTLWTRQVKNVADEINQNGTYRVKEEYIRKKNDTISDYYINLYNWYTKEAKNYITIPEDCHFPVWFSIDEEYMLQPVSDTVIIKVRIPKENVVVCNYEGWGYVVNYWYVPLDEMDKDKFASKLKSMGISSEDELFLTDKGNFYPILKQEVIKSWKRIFTLPAVSRENIVATAWEVKKEWVLDIKYYE